MRALARDPHRSPPLVDPRIVPVVSTLAPPPFPRASSHSYPHYSNYADEHLLHAGCFCWIGYLMSAVQALFISPFLCDVLVGKSSV